MSNLSLFNGPKKFAYIITRFAEYGGAQIHVRDLAKRLNDEGHEAVIVTGIKGLVAEDAERLGIEVIEVPELVREIRPATDLKAIFALRRLFRERQPDLVTLHSSKAGIVGRIAAWLCGIPSVFTAHGWAFTDGISRKKQIVYAAIERFFAPFSAHIITVSDFDRQIARDRNVGRPDRMTAIINGMPVLPAPARPAADPDKPAQLIMVARFAPQKNHTLLLDALAPLKDLNWSLKLAGGGDDSAVRAQAEALGLAEKIDFLGERRDIPDLLAGSDVFLLISRWEGLPLAIVEAMRAELPVIISDVGGSKEVIEEGKTGFAIGRNDQVRLTERLRQLIEDPELARKMGEAGRSKFEDELTFDIMAHKTFEVYAAAISGTKGS